MILNFSMTPVDKVGKWMLAGHAIFNMLAAVFRSSNHLDSIIDFSIAIGGFHVLLVTFVSILSLLPRTTGSDEVLTLPSKKP
jgi:hypothetical protein